MEKKNTMLLTVIAVATLLVAVVGATFAYFSLSATSESNTTGTVTTPKIGTVSISPVNEKLYLTLTASDMSKENVGTTYYATTEETGTGGNSNAIAITKADIEGAEDGAKYSCVTTVKVTASGGMLQALQPGWAKLSLSGSGVTESDASNIDLSTLKDTDDGKTFTGTAVLTANAGGTGTANILNAVLSFTNVDNTESHLTDGVQNAIAGTTLEVSIEVTGGSCTLQTGE